ncbi:MAG: hypothetical protein JNM39_04650 [Bdellovibrionaceae bacterium]|nr:hypothetical protein [Pseudobdellovibrionaceae bacterium]
MKSLLMILVLASFAMPVHAKKTTTCMTEKGTELKLVWDNISFPAKPVSLVITAKGSAPSDRTASIRNFGTSGGSPRFGIDGFPTSSEETDVSLSYTGNMYFVGKKGSSFKKEFEFTSCDTTSAEVVEPAGPGGF